MTLKIAVIDDSSPFRLLVEQLLESEECKVEGFAEADDFLNFPTRNAAYDLIMMDINMPGLNGLHALELLKSNPATAAVPVLLLSGDSRRDTVVKGVKLGAHDFLMKPIDPQQLVERVASILQR